MGTDQRGRTRIEKRRCEAIEMKTQTRFAGAQCDVQRRIFGANGSLASPPRLSRRRRCRPYAEGARADIVSIVTKAGTRFLVIASHIHREDNRRQDMTYHRSVIVAMTAGALLLAGTPFGQARGPGLILECCCGWSWRSQLPGCCSPDFSH